jgi:hypothetical protein
MYLWGPEQHAPNGKGYIMQGGPDQAYARAFSTPGQASTIFDMRLPYIQFIKEQETEVVIHTVLSKNRKIRKKKPTNKLTATKCTNQTALPELGIPVRIKRAHYCTSLPSC